MLVYCFAIPEADNETAFSMLGTNARAELIYRSEGDTLRVNKAQLALTPQANQCESWAQLIQLVHPTYSILIEAEKELILTPTHVSEGAE